MNWQNLLRVVIALLLLPPIYSHAAQAAEKTETARLFASTAPLDITLTADWAAIARDQRQSPPYYKAELTAVAAQSFDTAIPLKIRPRGKSRRIKEHCAFPPLRLNFSPKQMADTVFAGQDKLKLVTHCTRLGNNSQTYSDQLHSEYLLYRIFNLVTPNSFAVRRLNITYAYPADRNKRAVTHPAFVIEHKSALADRTGTLLAEEPNFKLQSLNAYQAELGALFAYFAGNTDYSFTRGPQPDECCHNSIALRGSQGVLPVPYDFDSTGFVDPDYAAPAEKLRLRTVTQRLYRGFCRHQGELGKVKEAFLSAQQSIEKLIQEYPDISAKRRRKLSGYTAAFYATLSNPKSFQRRISDRCRQ